MFIQHLAGGIMAHRITRRSLGALALNMAAIPAVRAASTLPAPEGKTILTISGRIGASNKGGTAEFDEAMLEALGTTEALTCCPWYDGQVRFEGVRMDRLLDWVGARGDRVEASGSDQYSAPLPRGDFGRYGVILALRLNGATVSTPSIGPLFIVYPYDSKPELRTEQFYGRSVWQVAKLVVT